MVEVIGLKLLYRDPLEWHYLHTKFHENLPIGLKVYGGQTDIQTAWSSHKPIYIFGK
jgi:hypothetical protein